MVLPLAVLPTLMLLYAGASNGGYYAPGLALSGWAGFALLFLAAELFTVRLMGELIHRLARGISPQTSFDSAFFTGFTGGRAAVDFIADAVCTECAVQHHVRVGRHRGVMRHAVPRRARHAGTRARRRHARSDLADDVDCVGAWAILSAIAALPAMVR